MARGAGRRNRVRLTKIYTRRGDDGTTGLVGGERIAKTALRLEAYGTIDELNCHLGVIRTGALACGDAEVRRETEDALRRIQNDLFDIGGRLATAPGRTHEGMPDIGPERVADLEARIDRYQEALETLPSFVLPGGGTLNAHAHVARAVCRRAERLLWRLHAEEPVAEPILHYVNRLSDYLFVYSRWVSRRLGDPEYLWGEVEESDR